MIPFVRSESVEHPTWFSMTSVVSPMITVVSVLKRATGTGLVSPRDPALEISAHLLAVRRVRVEFAEDVESSGKSLKPHKLGRRWESLLLLHVRERSGII